MEKNVLAICLNPVLQKTIFLEHFWENEVNRSREHYLHVAGKGMNTARVLGQLGIDAVHLTHAGGSRLKEFLDLVQTDDISIEYVDSQSEIRSCYTLINRENHSVTEIVEEAQPVAEGTEKKAMDLFDRLLPQFSCVTISGTVAAGYSDAIIPKMVKKAKAAEKMVVLDIKGDDLLNSLEYGPDFIKPNFKEFAGTLFPDKDFKEHADDEEALQAVKNKMIELWKKGGITSILTRGIKPILFCSEGKIEEAETGFVTPINTIGSGDSFTAGLTAALLEGKSLMESIHSGQKCGRLNALQIQPGSIR